MMKKEKALFRFLALCLNAVNLWLLILSLYLQFPAWFVFLITLADAVISYVNAAYDWSDAKKET